MKRQFIPMSKARKGQVKVIKLDILKGTLSFRYVLLFSGALCLVIKQLKNPNNNHKNTAGPGGRILVRVRDREQRCMTGSEPWSRITHAFLSSG